jgi:hypothetical protein
MHTRFLKMHVLEKLATSGQQNGTEPKQAEKDSSHFRLCNMRSGTEHTGKPRLICILDPGGCYLTSMLVMTPE